MLISLPFGSEATALTYNIAATEKACFYALTDKPGKKIGFYFAVQQGGSFDVDYEVKGPRDEIILNGQQEKQADYVFTATDAGEYSFCFANEMSTFAEKLVDFEILVEHDVRPDFKPAATGKEQVDSINGMESILASISSHLNQISRSQRYFRTREHRNGATVTSTQSRMFWFSLLESLAIISIAALQTFVVKSFFNTKKGGV
ncbi:emp24/gp25L/p24 family/GOLD-domain-containing protein [Sporodiniella umbellata]|nr:emp24/gp25L/p24 family/GOLD-domain-containing protein [Sporodiniella umbellata]